MHVPEENLPRYRSLKRIADKFDSLGNDLSNLGDHEEANKAWIKSGKYNRKAHALRVPGKDGMLLAIEAERAAAKPPKPIHRPNGPYLPVGDLGGEYCVKCRTPWPCAAVLPGGSHHEHEDCCK